MQFAIVNEFEETFSASTTVDCWKTFRLADVDAPTGRCTVSEAPCVSDEQCIDANAGFCDKNSVFSLGRLGTSTAFTRITPVALDGGVLTVAEEVHYNNLLSLMAKRSNSAWAAWNPQAIGNRYDATDPNQGGPPGGPVVDIITRAGPVLIEISERAMVFSSSGEKRRPVMGTKMGFWRWALASAAILIATGAAGARVIDPTGVTTQEPAAITLFPRLKVDLNTCVANFDGMGFCSLTPEDSLRGRR